MADAGHAVTFMGCLVFLNGVAVAELPALTIVLGRVGFAAMALFIFMKWAGLAMPMNRQIWRAFL